MSKYEFLAEHAIFSEVNNIDEKDIDKVVKAEGRYSIFKKATMRTKAQILATGLWVEYIGKKELVNLIKNGRARRKDVEAILGYPGLVSQKYSDTSIFKPKDLGSDPQKILEFLPEGSCFFKIDLKLISPFYSRDDISFYPHENPLRREWVFHWPYLSAAAVKGLLRWSWRMCYGDEFLDLEEMLFGSRKEVRDEDKKQQGCIYTYPIFWEGDVGLDVINPHSRETNTGTQPIKYEVVRHGVHGIMQILFFNRKLEKEVVKKIIPLMGDSLDFLLNDSALSAKRTAGWGSVKITRSRCFIRGDFKKEIEPKKDEDSEVDRLWDMATKEGELLPLDSDIFTTKNLAKLAGVSVKMVRKDRKKVYERIKALWTERQKQKSEKHQEDDRLNIEKVKEIVLDNNIKKWAEQILKMNA